MSKCHRPRQQPGSASTRPDNWSPSNELRWLSLSPPSCQRLYNGILWMYSKRVAGSGGEGIIPGASDDSTCGRILTHLDNKFERLVTRGRCIYCIFALVPGSHFKYSPFLYLVLYSISSSLSPFRSTSISLSPLSPLSSSICLSICLSAFLSLSNYSLSL